MPHSKKFNLVNYVNHKSIIFDKMTKNPFRSNLAYRKKKQIHICIVWLIHTNFWFSCIYFDFRIFFRNISHCLIVPILMERDGTVKKHKSTPIHVRTLRFAVLIGNPPHTNVFFSLHTNDSKNICVFFPFWVNPSPYLQEGSLPVLNCCARFPILIPIEVCHVIQSYVWLLGGFPWWVWLSLRKASYPVRTCNLTRMIANAINPASSYPHR